MVPDFRVIAEEERRHQLLKLYGSITAVLALLVLFAGLLTYIARSSVSAVATDVTELRTQAVQEQARLAKLEADLQWLNLQNSTLREGQEKVRTELQALEFRQQHVAVKKSHPTTAVRKSLGRPSPALPPPWLIGPVDQRSPDLEVVRTPSVTSYFIR